MGILSDLINGDRSAIISLLYQLPAVLIALTLHEMAHGYVAWRCGDPTARMMGRLSFNPLHHLDPIGTLCMFLFGIGWAKPVPVNPRNYKNFKRDDILVSFAGIAVNLCLFLLGSLLMVIVQQFIFKPEFYQDFYGALYLPGSTHLWDAFPALSQLDLLSMKGTTVGFTMSDGALTLLAENGMTHYVQAPFLMYVQRFLMHFSLVNLSLALFNLLPIPPLDGYHLFNDILFRGKLHIPAKVVQGITMVFMLVLAFTDIISGLLSTAMYFLQDKVMRLLLLIFGGL